MDCGRWMNVNIADYVRAVVRASLESFGMTRSVQLQVMSVGVNCGPEKENSIQIEDRQQKPYFQCSQRYTKQRKKAVLDRPPTKPLHGYASEILTNQ